MDNSTSSTTPSASNSTIEPQDRLSELPVELKHLIIGYLYPTHNPDKAYTQGRFRHTDPKAPTPASHSLDYLAAANKSLRRDVMEWSRIFLNKQSDITRYKPLKDSKLQAQRNFLRGRGGLLTWSEKNCVFCGKKAARSAILMNGLRCCNPCDAKQWPGKITKTDARKEYHLKDYHLFRADCPTPRMDKALSRLAEGLPKARYGTFWNAGCLTTMFIRAEIEVLAELAHGDLKECFEQKKIDLRMARKEKEAAAAEDFERRERMSEYLSMIL